MDERGDNEKGGSERDRKKKNGERWERTRAGLGGIDGGSKQKNLESKQDEKFSY